ncbi:MAG: hypothetical protein ACE5HB_03005, partial [Terriglobia bacterium]
MRELRVPSVMSLTVLPVLLLVSGTAQPVRGQANRLTEEEQNTIEIFRQASRGVVHIEARAVMESQFERQTIESSAGTGFFLDQEGRILTALHLIKDKNQ